jgi:putative transcriptional regulator
MIWSLCSLPRFDPDVRELSSAQLTMPSLTGHLLVASPKLADPNFARCVILIIQHGEEGAFGLVLNRATRSPLAEIWSELFGGVCAVEGPLYIGGPVDGPPLAVHGDADCSEREVLSGVHLASQPSTIEQLVTQPQSPVRVFLGYSGWGEGQLESELREGAWLTAPAAPEHVFYGGDDLWKEVVTHISGAIIHSRGDIKHVPPQPWHN